MSKIYRKSNHKGSKKRSILPLWVIATLGIMLSVAVIGVAAQSSGATPIVNTTISVSKTGSEPFDVGVTWDGADLSTAGYDEEADNNVVRIQDSITYRVEVSVNDNSAESLIAEVSLENDDPTKEKQRWIELPTGCKDDPDEVDPVSSISADGLTLICNTGPAIEGTTKVVYPTARVVGISEDGTSPTLNDDIVNASVSAQADGISNIATDESDDVIVTGNFQVNTYKELLATKVVDGRALYAAPHAENEAGDAGSLIEYIIRIQYQRGSMMADAPDEIGGDFEIDITLLDHYTDDNANNNIGSLSTGAVLYDWDPEKASCELLGDHGPNASVTCTQVDYILDQLSQSFDANGESIPDGINDPNIEIQLNNIDVRDPDSDANLVELKLNIWYSEEDDIETSDNEYCRLNSSDVEICSKEIFTINSVGVYTATGGATGGPTVVGFNPVSTEDASPIPNNLLNYNGAPGEPFPDYVTYPLIYTSPGTWTRRKSFYGTGNNTKSPDQLIAPGASVPFLINLYDYRRFDGALSQNCDKIDTTVFEFEGLAPPSLSLGNELNNQAYNPNLGIYNSADRGFVHVPVPADQWTALYANMPISPTRAVDEAAYLVALKASMCEDDLNDDGVYVIDGMIAPTGTMTTTAPSDWVTNPTLIGGLANVTHLRTQFSNDVAYADSVTTPNSRSIFAINWQVKVKADAVAYGAFNYLPNFSGSRRNDSPAGEFTNWTGLTAAQGDAVVSEVDFSYNIYDADRMVLIDSSISIEKYTEPRGIKVIRGGDLLDFIIEPQVFGGWGPTITVATIDDPLPTGTDYVLGSEMFSTDDGTTWLTYDEYISSSPVVSITTPANSNPRRLDWDFDDLQSGDQLPLVRYTVQVDSLLTTGTFKNTATLDSPIGGDDDENGVSDPKTAVYEISIFPDTGLELLKSVDYPIYETNAPFEYNLIYKNLGGEDYSGGDFIDILPYNGDGSGNTSGLDSTRTPASSFSGTYEVTGISRTNSEVFYATDATSSSIQQDVCHESNQLAGATPASGDVCYLMWVNNGEEFSGGSREGTGTTTWVQCTNLVTITCGALDPASITGIRFTTPSLGEDIGGKQVNIELTPTGNVGGTPALNDDRQVTDQSTGDIYTNNFGGRVPEISLQVISNDVSVTMVSGSIGDRVWHDDNGNGAQDVGELGIAGVTMQLLDAAGDPVYVDPVTGGIVPMGTVGAIPYETVTDAYGNYSFDNLPSDDYSVVVLATTLPAGVAQTYDASGALDNQSDHTLTPTTDSVGQLLGVEDNTEQDFGYRPLDTASLGNYVWLDENNDGIQNAGERGIPNAIVTLTPPAHIDLGNGAGVAITTTTDTTGNYLFDNLPAEDGYVVSIDQTQAALDDNGLGYTVENNDGADTNDADFGNQNPDGYTVDLSEGEVDLSADFGFNYNSNSEVNGGTGLAALGDTIWIDSDGDGIQDPSEIGVSGVEVVLYGDPDGDGIVDTPMMTTTTDANGHYIFDSLTPGLYSVEVTDSTSASHDILNNSGGSQYFQTGDPDHFGTTGTDNDNYGDPVLLAPGDVYLNMDFGYQPAGSAALNSIGDTIFYDEDADGVDEAEDDGIAGVSVSLIDDLDGNGQWDPGEPIIATDVTDENGNYLFEDLPDGNYIVWVNDTDGVLTGMDPTADPEGLLDNLSSVDLDSTESSATSVADLDQDFGYSLATPVGVIGDSIWFDVDGSGGDETTQSIEPGIGNVTVNLYLDEDGNGEPDDVNGDGVIDASDLVASTTTDINGEYLFTGLPYGDYIVDVDETSLPAGIDTAATYEADGDTDGYGATVTLDAANPEDLDQDFSYTTADTTLGSIGDTIFGDMDGAEADGTPDAGDVTLAGVTVILTDDSGNTWTTETDANGNYLFDSLPAANYTVTVNTGTLPEGFSTTSTYDADGGADSSSTLTLTAGEHNRDQDFSYPPTGETYTVGDTIWFDKDDSGGDQSTQGAETGLEGVEVSIYDSTGALVATTTTDQDGYYLFTGLVTDTYTISVNTDTLPAFVTTESTHDGSDNAGAASGDSTSVVTVDAGNPHSRDEDFSYGPNTPGMIGDTIWFDLDGNGGQDAGEGGIPGVVVSLTLPDGSVVTTTTDAQGHYIFTNLPTSAAGETYTVTVDASTLPGGISQTWDDDGTATANQSVTTLTTAAPIDLDQDFGYNGDNSIGNLVFLDSNADGTFDADGADNIAGTDDDESLLADVTVELYLDSNGDGVFGPGDALVSTTTTAGTAGTVASDEGNYLFENLPDGTYFVHVSDDEGTLNGYWHSEGTADTTDESQNDAAYTVDLDSDSTSAAAVQDLTADFGYYIEPASIGNYVWLDLNGDGLQDASEDGIDGVEVTLDIEYPDGTTVKLTTLTGDNPDTATVEQGWYSFDSLLIDEDYNTAGTGSGGTAPAYTLSVDTNQPQLGAYDATTVDASDATADMDDSDDHSGTNAVPVQGLTDTDTDATPTDEQAIASYDFGFIGDADVGDTIWFDQDGDGVIDADESGIPGIQVTMTVDIDGDGTPDITETTTTDQNGEYLFETVPPGNVIIVTDAPGGYDPTFDNDGGLDNTSAITVTNVMTEDLAQDFGYNGVGSLGDTVWFDADGDDTQDANEPGFPNVPVTLTIDFNGDGTPDHTITTTTGTDGTYLFDNLLPGDYTVEVGQPAGTDQTYDASGSQLDSTSNITLTTVITEDLNQDFGYNGTGSIGDQVFFDINQDGLYTPSEDFPIEGIVVTLTLDLDGDGIGDYITTTVTASDGTYLFDNLPAGDYTVEVDVPDAWIDSTDPDGGSDDKSELTLTAGEDNLAQDFGYLAEGELGDTVWWDINEDGVLDANEVGYPGVPVTLTLDLTGNGIIDKTYTTTTDADGEYLFENLPPGQYEVVVGQPSGTEQTWDYDDELTALDNTSAITLTAVYTSDMDQDFGYNGIGSIGDTVWWDADEDGVQDAGEPGMPGVVISLSVDLDGNGTIDTVLTTTTSITGTYLFENLPAADYTIVSNPADGWEQTFDDEAALDNTSEHALGADEDNRVQDFGYTGTGELGDIVWFDQNEDGVLDSTEIGIPGITVTLEVDITGDGVADYVTSTVTAADGSYLFENLPPGDYTTTITPPVNYDPTYDFNSGLVSPDNTSTITLTSVITQDLDQDYGLSGDSSIGDFVWYDIDMDGVDDPGEPGLPGVVISLTMPWGGVITTTTDADGFYLFDNLPPGDYVITASEPAGTTNTYDENSGNNDPDNESTYSLADEEDEREQDFGYIGDGSIGNFVWFDANDDGVQDADEPGLSGITVTLDIDFDADGTIDFVITTTTDADGNYLFENLPEADYTVTVVPPAGYAQTFDADGSGNDASDYSLGAEEDNVTQDFGYTGSGELGDTIWWDVDGDGTYSPTVEAGIPGVLVTLTVDLDLDGTADYTATMTTDQNGEYLFENLPPGDYTVTVDQPGGTTQTADADGGNDNTSDTTLTISDTVDLDQDHGYNGDGSIGDTVYFDHNADGDQDAGDPGIAGLTVTLGVDLNGDGIIDHTLTTTTDEDGKYLFDNLPEGDYTVTVTPPAGFDQTQDPDGGADNMSEYALAAGEDNLDQDFGYVGAGSIGDTIWFDQDADGTMDANENGLPGITVTVSVDWDDDGVADFITTTVTAADGTYLVDNLPPGDYTVTTSPPAGYDNTYDADGGTDDTSEYPLADDEDNVDQDFGYAGTGSIGDTIYYDLNGDGNEDQLEGGIPNVVVELTLPWGEVITTTTNSNGEYLFENLPPGDYTVTINESTLPADVELTGDPHGGLDHTSSLTLGNGVNNLDQDFGYEPLVPAIKLEKTVYAGHDGGAGCQGGEFVNGAYNAAITYCFEVTNMGNTHLNNIEVGDPALGITLTVPGNLAPAASATVYYETGIDGYLLNTAEVSGNPTDENGNDLPTQSDVTADDSATVSENIVTPLPNLDLEKTVYEGHNGGADCDGVENANNFAGTSVTFCFTVENIGNVDLADVTITDPTYGLTFTMPMTLTAGSSETFHYETVITGTLVNEAEAVGQPYDERGDLITTVEPPTDHDNATILSVAATPAIQLEKTVYAGHDAGIGCATGGENVTDLYGTDVTFCFLVTNTGNTWLENVTVADPILGITLTIPGVLSPTNSATVSHDATITSSVVNTAATVGNPINEAGEDITDVDDPTDEDTASVSMVTPLPAIELEKTVYDGHDDGVSCAGVSALVGAIGTPVTYCFVVQNTGNTYLSNGVVTDADLGITLNIPGILAPMEIVTLTAESTINGVLLNSAETVANPTSSNGTDIPDLTDPTDSDTALVSDELLTAAIEVEKTVYQGHNDGASCTGVELVEAILNTNVTWCFEIENAGTTNLEDVTLYDSLLGITLTVPGTLNAGTSTTLHHEGTIQGDMVNSAEVIGNPVDDSGNELTELDDPTDSDTAAVSELTALPAIELEKTVYIGDNNGASCAGSELVIGTAGETATYCFEVTNTGNTPLSNVTVSDQLLGITITVPGILAPNASVTVFETSTIESILVNTAAVEGVPVYDNGNPIPDVDNPTDTNTAAVADEFPVPAIDLEKTVYLGHDGGDSCTGAEVVNGLANTAVTYCFEVTNSGRTHLNGIVLVDPTLGITLTSDALLAPNETVTLYAESTITQSLVNIADVTANPVDENGADIPTLPDTEDSNDAAVILDAAPTGSLGDTVWLDADNDGTLDNGEAEIAGVVVNLLDGNGDPVLDSNNEPITTTTNADGEYLFTDLPEGDYIVELALENWQPGGVFGDGGAYEGGISSTGQAGDDGVNGNDNGDDDVSDGIQSTVISLAAGENEPSVDFGIFTPMALGNVIFQDNGAGANNNNGVFDDDEVGIDAVTVQLYEDTDGDSLFDPDVDQLISTTVTAGGGYYLFENLVPDSYFVHIPASEFAAGGGLFDEDSSIPMQSSSGFGGDDSSDENANENGVDDQFWFQNGTTSTVIDLDSMQEPSGEMTGTPDGYADSNVNQTVDFGFFTADSTAVGLESTSTTSTTVVTGAAAATLLAGATGVYVVGKRRKSREADGMAAG